ALRVGHHPQKFPAVFDLGARNALVGIQPHQVVPGALGVLGEKFLLRLQAVELIFLIRGHTAIGCNVHGSTSLTNFMLSVTTIILHRAVCCKKKVGLPYLGTPVVCHYLAGTKRTSSFICIPAARRLSVEREELAVPFSSLLISA